MLLRPVLVSSLYLGAENFVSAKQVKTCDIEGPTAFSDHGTWDCNGNIKGSECKFDIFESSQCSSTGAFCNKKGNWKTVKQMKCQKIAEEKDEKDEESEKDDDKDDDKDDKDDNYVPNNWNDNYCGLEPTQAEIPVTNRNLATKWICHQGLGFRSCSLDRSSGCRGSATCMNGVWTGSGSCKFKKMCTEKPGSDDLITEIKFPYKAVNSIYTNTFNLTWENPVSKYPWVFSWDCNEEISSYNDQECNLKIADGYECSNTVDDFHQYYKDNGYKIGHYGDMGIHNIGEYWYEYITPVAVCLKGNNWGWQGNRCKFTEEPWKCLGGKNYDKPKVGIQCRCVDESICGKPFPELVENDSSSAISTTTTSSLTETTTTGSTTTTKSSDSSTTTSTQSNSVTYGTCSEPAPIEGGKWDCSKNKKHGWMCALKPTTSILCKGKPVVCRNGEWKPRKSAWKYPMCFTAKPKA